MDDIKGGFREQEGQAVDGVGGVETEIVPNVMFLASFNLEFYLHPLSFRSCYFQCYACWACGFNP